MDTIKKVYYLLLRIYWNFIERPIKLLVMKSIQTYVWKRNPDVRRRYLIERDTPYGCEYPSEWHELSRAIHNNKLDPRNKTRIQLIYRVMCKYAYHYDSYLHYSLNTKDNNVNKTN